jgi:hypothetical protein
MVHKLFEEKTPYNTSPYFLIGVIDGIAHRERRTDAMKLKEIKDAIASYKELTNQG